MDVPQTFLVPRWGQWACPTFPVHTLGLLPRPCGHQLAPWQSSPGFEWAPGTLMQLQEVIRPWAPALAGHRDWVGACRSPPACAAKPSSGPSPLLPVPSALPCRGRA